jgi:phosphate acetyltransferase
MHLVDQIKEKAKKNLQTVVLPESYDERMLYAAEKIVSQGLAKLVVLGDPAKIQADAAAKGINLTGVELLNPADSSRLDQYVADFVELRKAKGMTPEEARKLLTAEDNLYYAGMMVRNGDAGGEVAGATGTTGNVLKAAFQTVGPAAGIKTVSSFFLMITQNPGFGENGILLTAR